MFLGHPDFIILKVTWLTDLFKKKILLKTFKKIRKMESYRKAKKQSAVAAKVIRLTETDKKIFLKSIRRQSSKIPLSPVK